MFDDNLQGITFFTDPLILAYVTEFLTIRQKLLLTSLNKNIRSIMQNYFKVLCKQNKLQPIPKKSAIHQMNFYFGRCLRIFEHTKQQKQIQLKEQSKVRQGKKRKMTQDQIIQAHIHKLTIQKPFKFTVITAFQVGPVYGACINNDNQAYVFRTNKVLSLTQNNQPFEYEMVRDIANVQCKGDRLVMLNTQGQVTLWQTFKQSMQLWQNKNVLAWTQKIAVREIKASFNYIIFDLKQPFSIKQHLLNAIFQYNQQGIQNEVGKDYYMVVMNTLTGMLYLLKLPAQKIVSFAVGNKQAFFVSQNYQILHAQFEHINQGIKQIIAKPFAPFVGKKIIKVAGGHNFYLAIQKDIKNIELWSTEEVIVWLRDIGFGDFVKIARAEKLDGKKLNEANENYLNNALGMTKLNVRQKFMLCIQEMQQGKHEGQNLWVWGKNQFGQLGANHANFIANPHKIKMDFIQTNDRVDSIFCGWFQTFLRTQRGKIYQTIIQSQRKKKKSFQEPEFDLSQDQTNQKNVDAASNKFKKKKKKVQQDNRKDRKPKKYQDRRQKKYQQEQQWEQSKAGKAFFISAFKDYTFFIQCLGWQAMEQKKPNKVKSSKAIIDRIFWDTSLDKSQFRIGVLDANMGLIQVAPSQLTMYDYKQNHVKYVKRNKVVVWDRQNKIDYL